METVCLVDSEPDLFERLDPSDLVEARARARVSMRRFSKGPWVSDQFEAESPRGHLGLLVMHGLLARRVFLGERSCVELLGPGDVLRPWVRIGGNGGAISLDVRWRVMVEVGLAELNERFALAMAPWPAVVGTLMDRVILRSRWLAFHLAVCHIVRVDERLRVSFWHFADRWGKVTSEGVLVPIAFTHELLATVVGARRPTVSTALRTLQDEGMIERTADGWLLRGAPPAELRQIEQAAAGIGGRFATGDDAT